jgi:hypothetical protein
MAPLGEGMGYGPEHGDLGRPVLEAWERPGEIPTGLEDRGELLNGHGRRVVDGAKAGQVWKRGGWR